MTKHLPIKTSFCEAVVNVCGFDLYFDGNSKITAGNGSYLDPKPNAFSLPAASVSSSGFCPGSTDACRGSCYVKGLAHHAPDLYARYYQNADALSEFLGDLTLFARSAHAVGSWAAEHAPHGFRWHVSGDVWNLRHALWIRHVCEHARNVQFWIYTRTFEAVPGLAGVRNLSLNLSADAYNFDKAMGTQAAYGGRICYLSSDGHVPRSLPRGSVVFPDYPIRGRDLPDPRSAPFWQSLDIHTQRMVCPTDFFGQSEAHRCGPCSRCLEPTA